jgi:hypothetical protein
MDYSVEEEESFSEKPASISGLTKKKAKRDHLIVQNQFRFDIKKGDDLSEIPEHFHEALKAEKVI